jgi:hypothetical protein
LTGKFNPAENSIQVRIPVRMTMTFPVRDGDVVAGDGGVDCNRTLTQPGVRNQGVGRRNVGGSANCSDDSVAVSVAVKIKKTDKQTSTDP